MLFEIKFIIKRLFGNDLKDGDSVFKYDEFIKLVELKLNEIPTSCHFLQEDIILGRCDLHMDHLILNPDYCFVGSLKNSKNLEFSPRPFVRSSVPDFLKNRSLLFSETWQLVRTQKGGKNVPSAFLKNAQK